MKATAMARRAALDYLTFFDRMMAEKQAARAHLTMEQGEAIAHALLRMIVKNPSKQMRYASIPTALAYIEQQARRVPGAPQSHSAAAH